MQFGDSHDLPQFQFVTTIFSEGGVKEEGQTASGAALNLAGSDEGFGSPASHEAEGEESAVEEVDPVCDEEDIRDVD